MRGSAGQSRAALWWALTIVFAVAFFAIALSDTVYNITSPPGPLQILLRKSYSIAAFAIVGYLFSRATAAAGRPQPALVVALVLTGYSLTIEIAQAITSPIYEGLIWNVVDVACGFIGGYLGGAIRERLRLPL